MNFKFNKDFEATHPDKITGLLTDWPGKIFVEMSQDPDNGERVLSINLGTAARGLAARRIRELLKKMEK